MRAPDSTARGAPGSVSGIVELRAGQSIPARSKSHRIHLGVFHLHQDGDHTEPISPFARSICRRSREWTCESEGAKTRVSAVAARLPRTICRAMLDAHSTVLTHQIGVSDLQDGTCLGKRNGVRSARQVQGAVRRWGVLRFPRSDSNGARDARAARVRAVAARACDPRTPKVQHCQNCQSTRTLALERKRPVKPTEVFKVFKVR